MGKGDMEKSRGDGTLTMTTEPWPGVVIRLSHVILTNSITIIVITFYIVTHDLVLPWTVTMVVALYAVVLAFSLRMVMAAASWGTWLLDARGIEYRPRFERYRRFSSLRWDEVELVRWEKRFASFRGGETRITIPWHLLSRPQVEEGKRQIEVLLSDEFDLKDDALALWQPDLRALFANPPSLFARFVRLFGIALATTIIWLGVGTWIVRYAPIPESWRLNTFSIWSICLLFTALLFVERHYRDAKKLANPQWPWMGRRKMNS